MTIGIDADGILFDYVSVCAEYVNQLAGKKIATYENCHNWDPLKAWNKTCWKDVADYYFSRPGKVYDFPLMSEAKFLIEQVRLMTNNEFIIITACPSSWHKDRTKALKDHFNISESQVSYSFRKDLFKIDCLIDDYHENLRNVDGLRILPDRPWNRDTDGVAVVRTYNVYQTLDEVERIVKWNRKVKAVKP